MSSSVADPVAATPDSAAAAEPGLARAASISALSQLGAKSAHLAFNVVSTLAILRYLAPGAYSSYVLVFTLTTLAQVVAEFGLPVLAAREIARADPATLRTRTNQVLGTVVVLRLGLAVFGFVGCQLTLLVLHESRTVHLAAAMAWLIVLSEAILGVLVVTFQVNVAQQYEAGIRVVAEGVETGLVLIFIASGASFLWLFVPPVVGLGIGTLSAFVLTRRRFGLRLRPTRALFKPLIIEALPLGPSLLIAVFYLKLDSLVIAAMRPGVELGIYGAAYQPIEYLFLATGVVMNVVFPILARAGRDVGEQARTRFAAIYQRSAELLLIATVGVPVLLLTTAPGIVGLAFGGAYAESADPLRVLALALVSMTISAWQAFVLLIGGHQRATLAYNAAALVFAVGLCTLMVWRFGMIGAAWSAVITSVLVLITSTLVLRIRMELRLDRARVLVILGVAAGTAALLLGLDRFGVPWYLSLAIGTVGYGLVFWRLGYLTSLRKVL